MPIFLFTILLLLVGCKDEQQTTRTKQAEAEARQQAELAQAQMAKAQAEQALRQADENRERLQTLRIVALVALAGGAVLAIAWSGRPPATPVSNGLPNHLSPGQSAERLLVSPNTRPPTTGRIIDLPPVAPVERSANPSNPSARRRRRRYRATGRPPFWHPSQPPQSNHDTPTNP
jgi:hypothetical protein